jgi:hypothetical protein
MLEKFSGSGLFALAAGKAGSRILKKFVESYFYYSKGPAL